MGKKKKPNRQLSQAEIWDDSALIQSWDDALEEYKLYHSIHARGERVEDVLKAVQEEEEKDEEGRSRHQSSTSQSAAGAEVRNTTAEDLEDGELDEEAVKKEETIKILDFVTETNEEAAEKYNEGARKYKESEKHKKEANELEEEAERLEEEGGKLDEEAVNAQTLLDVDMQDRLNTAAREDHEDHEDPHGQTQVNGDQSRPLNQALPEAVMHDVQDDALKNLMMSWYYAGYYTGLYHGQQQAQANTER